MLDLQQPRRRQYVYEPLTYKKIKSSPKRPSSKRRTDERLKHSSHIVSRKKRKKSNFDVFDRFKVLASIILLASSAHTYFLHSKLAVIENPISINSGKGATLLKAFTREKDDLSTLQKQATFKTNPSHIGQSKNNSLPSFIREKLIASSQYDAYSIAYRILSPKKGHRQTLKEKYEGDTFNINIQITELGNSTSNTTLKENNLRNQLQHESIERFVEKSRAMRKEFENIYGGNRAARAILQKALKSTFVESDTRDLGNFGNHPIEYTAQRFLAARNENRPFRFGFIGYSVTAGRGNYFNQSFPFVMQRLLEAPMKDLGIDLHVINAGIGGVPSFPTGLCLENHLGSADVVSWDFAMNEANDVVEGIEAYIRNVLSLNKNRIMEPMLIVKDTHMAEHRAKMIANYVGSGNLIDPLVVTTDPVVFPFLEMDEEYRPVGFQKWREFGSPQNAPGKSKHHPAKAEHEFIGWLIAMHFLAALELLAASDKGTYKFPSLPQRRNLPRPFSSSFSKNSQILGYKTFIELLIGKQTDDDENSWQILNHECRTSFEPNLEKTLSEVVISENLEDKIDIMLPKGMNFYRKGWVLDLGTKEKLAKQQLQRYDGLGFIDVKKSLYALYTSGTLQFFLPFLFNTQNNEERAITSIIICESNEPKESDDVCNLLNDMSFVVGTIEVRAQEIRLPGFSYLGRNICVHTSVPPDAKSTSQEINRRTRQGYVLEVSVTNKKISSLNKRCNISHLVWG